MSCFRTSAIEWDEDNQNEAIAIDVHSIPNHVRNDLARFALSLVEDVFAQPGAEKNYQQWLKERKRRQRA